jgi:hypothetical protein
VAKRANYGFVKRQKELQKKQRQDEKAEKKRLKAESAEGGQPDVTDDAGARDESAESESRDGG